MTRLIPAALTMIALVGTGCDIPGLAGSSEGAGDTAEIIVFDTIAGVDVESDTATIRNASLDGDELVLDVSYPGGCRDHEFSLYGWRGWDKSIPPGGHVYLSHDAREDRCDSLLVEELRFDLGPLKSEWRDRYNHRGDVRIEVYAPGDHSPTARLTTEI